MNDCLGGSGVYPWLTTFRQPNLTGARNYMSEHERTVSCLIDKASLESRPILG